MKMNLVKKIVATAAVMSLVLVSSMSVFAAGSPSATDAKVVETETEVGAVTIGGVTVTNASVKVTEATSATQKPTTAQVTQAMNNAGYTYNADTTKVVVADVTILDDNGNPVAGGALATPLTTRIDVDGVAVGDTVVVMNYYDGAWHAVTAKVVADGVVECTFEHLSPVAFAITKGGAAEYKGGEKSNAGTTTTSKASTASTGKTSPKTGE